MQKAPRVLFLLTLALMGAYLLYKYENSFAPPLPPLGFDNYIEPERMKVPDAIGASEQIITILEMRRQRIIQAIQEANGGSKTPEPPGLDPNKKENVEGHIEVFKKYNEDLHKQAARQYEAYVPMIGTIFLTLLAVGLLIRRKGDPDAEKWIYSTFGAILGYWLRGGT